MANYVKAERYDKVLRLAPITRKEIMDIYYPRGTVVEALMKVDKTWMLYRGPVVDNYDYFFNILVTTDLGEFLVSVNKIDLLTNPSTIRVKEVKVA